nr:hypothetical protein [Myxococcota bacterium]
MAEPDVAVALTSLGFSLNEGRAYAALLRWGPQTGYEVGQRAQVPRSAVYGALRRLVSVGAARSIAGTPERFVASPPDTVLALLRKRFDAQAETLESAIAELDVSLEVPDAFSVRGYERVMEEAERLVRTAEARLTISGWPRELTQLREALAEALGGLDRPEQREPHATSDHRGRREQRGRGAWQSVDARREQLLDRDGNSGRVPTGSRSPAAVVEVE